MDIQQMMQQAQQMQDKLKDMQGRVGEMEVTGTAGGGVVSVLMSCQGYVKKVSIDSQLANPNELEILEDLVAAACNDARSKADETIASETRRIMESMGLPGGTELPF